MLNHNYRNVMCTSCDAMANIVIVWQNNIHLCNSEWNHSQTTDTAWLKLHQLPIPWYPCTAGMHTWKANNSFIPHIGPHKSPGRCGQSSHEGECQINSIPLKPQWCKHLPEESTTNWQFLKFLRCGQVMNTTTSQLSLPAIVLSPSHFPKLSPHTTYKHFTKPNMDVR